MELDVAVLKPEHRQTKLPQREVEICHRVRRVRQLLRWKMPDFAKELGITKERLASYEYARAPIRYETAKQLCFRMNINQRWLAEGIEPMKPTLDISPHLEALFPARSLFSEAYDNALKSFIEERIHALEEALGRPLQDAKFEDCFLDNFPLVGTPTHDAAVFYIQRVCGILAARMSPVLLKEFTDAVMDAMVGFHDAHRAEIDEFARSQNTERQKSLTSPAAAVMDSAMPTWAQLKARVRRLTKERGAQAALARYCDVTRAAVATWLDADSTTEPGAKATLRLLDWVTAEEAKQKSSQSAQTLGEPKTQQRKPSSNEPPTSGRKTK